MKRTTILLATVSSVCALALVLALMLRPWDRAGALPPGEQAAPASAAAAGGPPTEGGTATAGEPGQGEAVVPAQGETAAPAQGEAAPPAPAEAPSFISEPNRREVSLFFQEADSEFLGAERRKIFLTSSIADLAKQIVVELINGPQEAGLLPTLPPQTRLRGLYLDRGGTAYVDLSSEVADLHPGGTGEEIATIYSLVDSLTYNLPEIKRVRILIGGEERETLKNHLDLRRDYRKDLSIVDMDRKSAP
ncbi:MAG TPA: GerMN domain-containing protein [Candidatus Polarisedimenticolia bacterium]|nr:GerMN domain-containing protein [Candidatus Polarisedimenticolia bacterium]